MKKIFLLILLSVSITIHAQTKPKPVKAKPVAAKPVNPLKTLNDSASYAIGISVGNAYKKQGLNQMNTAMVSKAINDFLAGNKMLFDMTTAGNVMTRYVTKLKAEKSKPLSAAPKPPAPKSTVIPKSLYDSACYAAGVNVGDFYKQLGVPKLNTMLLSKSINEVMAGKKVLLNDADINKVMNGYMTKLQEEKSKVVIEEGEKFLAENKLRPEVKVTPSGLQYEVVREGAGAAPLVTDSVTCHYKGTFLNGVEFDNSYKRGTPITFALTGVIRGWTEGLQLMKAGSSYKFYIPYNLGYGLFDYGNIPGGSTLLFDVELLDVKKGPGSPAGN
jgi:FKBP-type peptidyl-prolyl cis-trans isomerase